MIQRLFFVTVLLLGLSGSAWAQLTIDELVAQAGLKQGPVAMRDRPGWDGTGKIIVRDIGVSLAGIQQHFDDANLVVVTSLEQALTHAEDAGAVIGYCNDELLAAAPRLTWVQIFSSGAERCLESSRIGNGEVVLTNMQKMSSPVIGEHAIALMLALGRNLPQFAGAMEQGRWSRGADHTGGMTTAAGKTLLVLGLGGIGTEVAKRGNALGMRVIGTRNSSRQGPDFVDYVGLSDEMLELAKQAQVVVNALPLTDATRGLIGAEFFAAMPQGSYFINVGRGATVNTDDLLKALSSGRLAGAGLDVTDPEPLPADHALWSMDNVIITPHVSGRGGDRQRHGLLMMENIRRYIAGEALLNVVDPNKGY